VVEEEERESGCVCGEEAREKHAPKSDRRDRRDRDGERERERERGREGGRKRDGEKTRASENALGREIENDSGVYCIIPRWSTRETRARQVHALF